MDEIAKAQAELGRALAMATVGEDPQIRKRVREDGEQFIRLFNGLLRMTRVHDLENRAFEQPSHDLAEMIARLMELLGTISLVAVEDQVYINDIRIPMDRRWEGRTLDSELRRHNVGGLVFIAAPTEHHIRRLVGCFAAPPAAEAPRTSLSHALIHLGITGVQLTGIFRFRTTDEAKAAPVLPGPAAERAAGVVEEFWAALAEGRLVNPLPARRLVSDLLTRAGGLDADGVLAEPQASTAYGAHAWRVCVISLLLGRAAGLDDAASQDLGLCALFHDVGYAAREGVVKGGDNPHPGYAPPFERHGTAGARLLLHQKGFSEAKVRRALTTLEHHRDHNTSGEKRARERPFLFARIVRIAEDYDNYTHRAHLDSEAPGMPPAEALARMTRRSGRAYDGALLQILINTLGRFPPGTLLKLEDGRTVRVAGLVRDAERFDKPLCRVVRREDGSEPEETEWIDLAQTGRVLGMIR